MEKIAKTIADVFGCNAQIDREYGYIHAENDEFVVRVQSPHSGTGNRYMLRVGARASFDRWANSTAVEEFFATSDDLNNYMLNNCANIYKECIRCLHRDYHELVACFRDDSDTRWKFGFRFKNANKYRTKKKLMGYIQKLSVAYNEVQDAYDHWRWSN